MTTLALPLLWCVLQVTLVGLLTAGLYLAVRRFSPASSASVLLSGLVVAALLAVTAASPWPSWASRPSLQQATSVADGEIAAHEVPLPHGAEMPPIADSPATTPDVSRDHKGTSTAASGQRPSDMPGTAYFDRFLYGVDAMLLEPGRDAPDRTVLDEPVAATHARWPVYVAAVFGLAMLIGVLRFVIGWFAVRRQVARSRVLDVPALDALCEALRRELGCRRPVALRESAELATAATVGWQRPVILLPAAWNTWTADERRAVLAHELAHVARGHFAAWLIAQTGLVLHFYHPLIHWLAARLRLEQEYEADALAAHLTGGPHPYLQTLARLALHQSDTQVRWPARAFLPPTALSSGESKCSDKRVHPGSNPS